MAPIAKIFRSLCIPNETLTKFDNYLGECLRLFPPPLQLSSPAALDPCLIAPLCSFQNARILLHRHNLSPSSSPEQRALAIEQCLNASRDTASLLSRCMIPHIQSHDWEQRFVLCSTTLICTHMWRCMLFLLFRQCYDAFFLVLRAASTVDGARAVNVCVGRHLAFFLRRLIEHHEQPAPVDLESDEEMLVYLSGDLQASTNSWVWGNTETGTHLSRRQKHGRPKHALPDSDLPQSSNAQSPSWDNLLSEEEQRDWGGWQHIENCARYLQRLSESRQHQHDQGSSPFPRQPPTISTTPGPTLAPIRTPLATPGDSRSRITIANII
jgi:hypothetical protein